MEQLHYVGRWLSALQASSVESSQLIYKGLLLLQIYKW